MSKKKFIYCNTETIPSEDEQKVKKRGVSFEVICNLSTGCAQLICVYYYITNISFIK